MCFQIHLLGCKGNLLFREWIYFKVQVFWMKALNNQIRPLKPLKTLAADLFGASFCLHGYITLKNTLDALSVK